MQAPLRGAPIDAAAKAVDRFFYPRSAGRRQLKHGSATGASAQSSRAIERAGSPVAEQRRFRLGAVGASGEVVKHRPSSTDGEAIESARVMGTANNCRAEQRIA